MILFVNTFITNDKPNFKLSYQRGNLHTDDKLDILKYSLYSFSKAYKWSKVILYIELDGNYKDSGPELEKYCLELFNGVDIIYKHKRNECQSDWKQSYELLDDNLIWYYCNHDHIFFDDNTSYLEELVEIMKDEELCSLQFSHWPENIRTAKIGGVAPPKDPKTYQIHNNHISIVSDNFDSIQIITKELYRRWWFEGEFNHIKLPRPDFFGIGLAEIKPVPYHKVIIPLKELCRHYDGYQHVQPVINNNQCPSITIPLGFFENDIKIRYGYNDYKEGWTNINPKNNNYYAYDITGTDYKFTLNDLPLIWKDKISVIDSNANIDDDEMLQHRLKAVFDMVSTSPYFEIDEEVINKIFNKYLENFNYKIDA
jgi:hypothetical protein